MIKKKTKENDMKNGLAEINKSKRKKNRRTLDIFKGRSMSFLI